MYQSSTKPCAEIHRGYKRYITKETRDNGVSEEDGDEESESQVNVLSPWEGCLRSKQTHSWDAEPKEGETTLPDCLKVVSHYYWP